MSSIGAPNALAVTASFFILAGILVLAKAVFIDTSAGDEAAQKLAKMEQGVDLRFGLPLLVIGAVLHVFAQVVFVSFGPATTCLSLALAGALALFATVRELVIDKIAGSPSQVRQKPKLAVLPAGSDRREAEPRVVERAAQS